MIKLYTGKYTKADYWMLYERLYRATNCSANGKYCDKCTSKRACNDIDRLIDYVVEKLK